MNNKARIEALYALVQTWKEFSSVDALPASCVLAETLEMISNRDATIKQLELIGRMANEAIEINTLRLMTRIEEAEKEANAEAAKAEATTHARGVRIESLESELKESKKEADKHYALSCDRYCRISDLEAQVTRLTKADANAALVSDWKAVLKQRERLIGEADSLRVSLKTCQDDMGSAAMRDAEHIAKLHAKVAKRGSQIIELESVLDHVRKDAKVNIANLQSCYELQSVKLTKTVDALACCRETIAGLEAGNAAIEKTRAITHDVMVSACKRIADLEHNIIAVNADRDALRDAVQMRAVATLKVGDRVRHRSWAAKQPPAISFEGDIVEALIRVKRDDGSHFEGKPEMFTVIGPRARPKTDMEIAHMLDAVAGRTPAESFALQSITTALRARGTK